MSLRKLGVKSTRQVISLIGLVHFPEKRPRQPESYEVDGPTETTRREECVRYLIQGCFCQATICFVPPTKLDNDSYIKGYIRTPSCQIPIPCEDHKRLAITFASKNSFSRQTELPSDLRLVHRTWWPDHRYRRHRQLRYRSRRAVRYPPEP